MNKEKQRRNAEIYRPMCEELFNNLEKQYQELAKVKAESEKIEEMAWDLCDIPKHPSVKSCGDCGNKRCHATYYAQRAYNTGYRKQSEGEWIDLYKGKYANPLYACSVCEKGTLLRVEGNELGQPQTVQALSPYCPNCGAKMKGGAE